MFRLRYTLETTAQSLRQAPALSLVTVVTIGAALLVLGAYVAALQNLERLALSWGRTATVSAYLDDSLTESAWADLVDAAGHVEGVRHAELLRPERALAEFRNRGPEAAALVEGIDSDILPASIEIDVTRNFASLDQVSHVALALEGLEGISEVDYGREEFERLAQLMEFLRWIGIAAGLFVVAATAFIISNTIRLTVFARRDEIQILSLVGATARLIRAPFLLEGAVWGLAGGITASLGLFAADIVVAPQLSSAVIQVLGGLEVVLFTPMTGIALIFAGVLLGVVGSSLAVRRFLIDAETA
ncbi:MAG: permease-like cell division protein FtsX [Myxococcota bacterium]